VRLLHRRARVGALAQPRGDVERLPHVGNQPLHHGQPGFVDVTLLGGALHRGHGELGLGADQRSADEVAATHARQELRVEGRLVDAGLVDEAIVPGHVAGLEVQRFRYPRIQRRVLVEVFQLAGGRETDEVKLAMSQAGPVEHLQGAADPADQLRHRSERLRP
jgi:hypothetical protein